MSALPDRPALPRLNWNAPTDADLLAMTAHMAEIAALCQYDRDLPHNPAETVGGLTACGKIMERLIQQRIYVAERERQLSQRFADEARDEPAEPAYSSHDPDTGIAKYGEI